MFEPLGYAMQLVAQSPYVALDHLPMVMVCDETVVPGMLQMLPSSVMAEYLRSVVFVEDRSSDSPELCLTLTSETHPRPFPYHPVGSNLFVFDLCEAGQEVFAGPGNPFCVQSNVPGHLVFVRIVKGRDTDPPVVRDCIPTRFRPSDAEIEAAALLGPEIVTTGGWSRMENRSFKVEPGTTQVPPIRIVSGPHGLIGQHDVAFPVSDRVAWSIADLPDSALPVVARTNPFTEWVKVTPAIVQCIRADVLGPDVASFDEATGEYELVVGKCHIQQMSNNFLEKDDWAPFEVVPLE